MRQLVSNYMPEIPKGSVRGNNNASFKKFKKTTYSFRNKTRSCVGLLEVIQCIVKNKRNSSGNYIIKCYFKFIICFFGKISSNFSCLFHFTVIINIEMFGAENLPVKFFILNFIPAKKIELCGSNIAYGKE